MGYVVYIITNKKNGKCYIGWTGDKHARWGGHRSAANHGSTCYFHKALRKYTADGFDWEIIQTCSSQEEALQIEIFWIAELKKFNIKLYNMTDGGEGMRGWNPTEEWRKKQSESKKGIPLTETHKKALAASIVGRDTKLLFGSPGDKNPAAILASDKPPTIRYEWANNNFSVKELAATYGISISCIEDIIYNKAWKISSEEYTLLKETRNKNSTKNRKKPVILLCNKCGTSFERKLYEYNKCIRRNIQLFFCSKRCAILYRSKNIK